jgi:hypothetical protein
MATWEYRVEERVVGDNRWYEIIEVYSEKGKVVGTSDAVHPTGNTLEDLRQDLELMLRALDKPVIT